MRRALGRVLAAVFYYAFALPILFVACKLWFGYRVRRSSLRVPPLGGCVIVANHVHYLDAPLIAMAVWPRKLTVLVDRCNWDHPVVGVFMRVFECVPTGCTIREMREMFSRVSAVVDRGHALVVYPEGELVCYRQGLAPFKGGAFEIAAKAGVPVLPVALAQRGGWLCRLFGRAGFEVRLGTLVEPPATGSLRTRARALEEQARAQMEGLLGEE